MVWFKVDDALHSHPKARRAGLAAIGLWALAGSHCMAYLTDGYVERWVVESWPDGVALAGRLVDAGLWDTHPDGGWMFHDWRLYQPTKAQVDEDRRKERERKAAWRESKRSGTDGGRPGGTPGVSPGGGPGGRHGSPTRPDPTRPSTPNGVLPDARADGGRPGGTTAFGDGTPIPPEPDDDRAELVLVTDDAPVVEIGSRAPKVHIGSSVQTLVRQHVPAGIPKDVQRKVAEQAQRLANDPNVDRRDLEAALTEWARRSDAGPGLLPHLVADAARARQGGKAGAARPEHKTRTLARLIAEEESNDQKGIS
ncbi:hypothetical protein ACXYTP_19235 [Tsukamurella ocularis]|uniref:hypothetical protein n=1 Tax=Tsukamurella ocularis TaxID=1970234 RepID=UPI0039F12F0E